MLLAAIVALLTPAAAAAQQADSAAVQQADSAAATAQARRVPLESRGVSPRGAFLRSLLVPGWGQAQLDRGTAGALFVITEAMSATMAIKSKRALNRARDARGDSLFVGFETGNDGGFALDSLGNRIAIFQPDPLGARTRSRKQQFEDWLALLAFNHLFAGADAYVAAHLSDIPARVRAYRTTDGYVISAGFSW
jgi:hypothetical protein